MDIETIKQILAAVGTTITVVKQVKEWLPKGSNSKDIDEALKHLEQAEQQIKIAEAAALKGLGYEICYNHALPEAMRSGDGVNWKCPLCDSERFTGSFSYNAIR